jgi:hypothetical protein
VGELFDLVLEPLTSLPLTAVQPAPMVIAVEVPLKQCESNVARELPWRLSYLACSRRSTS